MTTSTQDLIATLAHHFPGEVVGKTEEQAADFARAHGLIYACMTCGTIGGIDVEAPLGNHASVEAARQATRAFAGDDAFECCGDGLTYLF